MSQPKEVNPANLRILCWQCGYLGVSGLAKKLKRSRTTLHSAVRWPDQYGPTYRLIKKALNER